ncbi:hypothetical protein P7C73_g2050, partial [Tremellales sp. Uapishka_1]
MTTFSDPSADTSQYRQAHPQSQPMPRAVSIPLFLHAENDRQPSHPQPFLSRQPPQPPLARDPSQRFSAGIHSRNEVLLQAESGGTMLAFSPSGDGVYRTGQPIFGNGTSLMPTPPALSRDEEELRARPWSDSTMSNPRSHKALHVRSISDGATLYRQGTLLHPESSNKRASAELGVLLGGPKSRRLSQTKLLPPPLETGPSMGDKVGLEASKKSKARVEVDVVLERECVVEGGEVRGRMEVRIRGGKRGEGLRVGGGKVRVVGFEDLSSSSRHIFYHQPHDLPVFASPIPASGPFSSLFASSPDGEGFRLAAEGTHAIPFKMRLPIGGGAKGSYTSPGGKGPSVRYVVVGSIKLYLPSSGKRSIAHFYRTIVVLPYLNPSMVLAPAVEPISAYIERGLGWSLTGEKGRVELGISMGRRIWVSGQRAWCQVSIENNSARKASDGPPLLLAVFIPNPHLDTEDGPYGLVKRRKSLQPGTPDQDACQTSTTRKKISEELMEADFADKGAGRVTGKGWWTGVEPGDKGHWDMSLQIPPGMLSIRRTRLIEVSYTLRVTVNGSIYVDLPIQLINFLSIDPPPMPGDGVRPLSQMSTTQANRLSQPPTQLRPYATRAMSDDSMMTAGVAARASSTTLHIDALLEEGRARALAEGAAIPLPRSRPLSMGSNYTVARSEDHAQTVPPPQVLHRNKSTPMLRPKGARVMSYLSVMSGGDSPDSGEGDEEFSDKTILEARRHQGRSLSLAAIHRAMDRQSQALEEEDEVIDGNVTPPAGQFRPDQTPSEEQFHVVGDTPSMATDEGHMDGMPVPRVNGVEVSSSNGHGPVEEEEDDEEEENLGGLPVGDQTVLMDLVSDQPQHPVYGSEYDEPKSGSSDGTFGLSNAYDYGEEVEDEGTEAQYRDHDPHSAIRDRDQHIQQSRSVYGSFAASVSAVSEQESEVGLVQEAVRRNMSVRLPPRVIAVESKEPRGYLDIPSNGPPRRSSFTPTPLSQFRRESSPSALAQRRGSAPNIQGLTMRRGSAQPPSPLRTNNIPIPPRVIAKRSSFSFATPGQPLRLSSSSPSPKSNPSAMLSANAETMVRGSSATSQSQLRNQVASYHDMEADGSPGLAPSVASDSASSDEHHALDSPPIVSPTEIGMQTEKRSLPSPPAEGAWARGHQSQQSHAETTSDYHSRSNASSPTSTHSILPSVKNKIAQMESRDEALRKFSVTALPAPMSASPPSPVAKRKSYTTALAPKIERTSSYDMDGGIGHTTYMSRKSYSEHPALPQRQSYEPYSSVNSTRRSLGMYGMGGGTGISRQGSTSSTSTTATTIEKALLQRSNSQMSSVSPRGGGGYRFSPPPRSWAKVGVQEEMEDDSDGLL